MKTMRLVVPALLTAAAAATISCGSVVRNSQAPVMLVMDTLQGLKGSAQASSPSGTLSSDVLTIVTSGGTCTTTSPCPTIFADNGQAQVHIILKDIGQPGATLSPSTNNTVTITRVHVSYRRTDGRNQEGVDIPYGFDTAATVSVSGTNQSTVVFPLVRSQAKEEAPLVQLVTSGLVISTIADVTLYGSDAVGNALSVTGSIAVTFANFGDQ
jgi:hypothetical protein